MEAVSEMSAIAHPFAGVPVSDLDASFDWYTVETYPNGVRHVTIPDPGGNPIAFAAPPDAT